MKKSINSLFLSLALFVIPCISLSSCSSDDEPEITTTVAEKYAGTYQGTITLNVNGQYSYDADISCTITEGKNGTITVTLPEYSLTGTMMGNMSLGEVTITDLVYDDSKGGFYRNFGGEGITQTMNGISYPLNDPTSILVKKAGESIVTIDYPFTLGKMPLPLTATFISK